MATEQRLIYADDAIKQCERHSDYTAWSIKDGIESIPTVDAVEVVRCKDCRHCMMCYPEKQIGKEATPGWYCKDQKKYRRPDDFCSYGERRAGE